jgi:hypothetical protein
MPAVTTQSVVVIVRPPNTSAASVMLLWRRRGVALAANRMPRQLTRQRGSLVC